MKILVVLTALFVCSTAFSYNCNKVFPLQPGEVIQCNGLFFPMSKAKEATDAIMNYKILLEQSKLHLLKEQLLKEQIIYSDKIALKEAEKATLWRTVATDITGKYIRVESDRGKRDWLFLTSGIVLTVLAGFAVGAAN